MPREIRTIHLPLPYRMGSVNCYLIQTEAGYVLIDTGASNKHAELEKELEEAGCRPGLLKLIILTHGDFDHTGNAARLREKFVARIAMHRDDSGMVEHGDIFWNRKKGNSLFRSIASILFRFGKSQRFTPDLYLETGQGLSEYGWDARVVHIPGHSKGSIGIVTAGGNLFCGDLIENGKKPKLNSIMDDPPAATASVQALRSLGINLVYPGHGEPFPMEQFLSTAGLDSRG